MGFRSSKDQDASFMERWIFLSLPTAFLGWSFVLLICSILSVIWRTSSSGTVFSPVDSATSSGLRAFITVIFGLGVIYLMLILRMFRRFGEPMDEAWEDRIKAWNADKAQFQINAMNTQLATPAIPSLPLSPITRTYEEHTLPLTSLPSQLNPRRIRTMSRR
ncbi:hypothetical protein BDQ17DRAFT_508833 [Cyathus striatus]|nr:hypothetical protein BDQ17DRAFT_508833 [Cyathus striatus]